MTPHERLGRALVQWGNHHRPWRDRNRAHRAAAAVGSWLLWGDYRLLRRSPGLYFSGVAERTRQRLAVRWYPEPSDDPEDCEACAMADDVCVFHRGVESCATYVERRVSPDLARSLFPEV